MAKDKEMMVIVHDSDFFELNVKPESDQELLENNSIEFEEEIEIKEEFDKYRKLFLSSDMEESSNSYSEETIPLKGKKSIQQISKNIPMWQLFTSLAARLVSSRVQSLLGESGASDLLSKQ